MALTRPRTLSRGRTSMPTITLNSENRSTLNRHHHPLCLRSLATISRYTMVCGMLNPFDIFLKFGRNATFRLLIYVIKIFWFVKFSVSNRTLPSYHIGTIIHRCLPAFDRLVFYAMETLTAPNPTLIDLISALFDNISPVYKFHCELQSTLYICKRVYIITTEHYCIY